MLLLKIEPSEITSIFYADFSRFLGDPPPVPPWLRHWLGTVDCNVQENSRCCFVLSERSYKCSINTPCLSAYLHNNVSTECENDHLKIISLHTFSRCYCQILGESSGVSRKNFGGFKVMSGLVGGPGAEPLGRRRIFENLQKYSLRKL